MIREQWKKIGIDLHRAGERAEAGRAAQRRATRTSSYAWVADGTEHLFTFPDHVFPSNVDRRRRRRSTRTWFRLERHGRGRSRRRS